MTTSPVPNSGVIEMAETPPATEDMDEQMARYGISRVPADQFHYKSYRYSNLRDAIAQAQREEAADRK